MAKYLPAGFKVLTDELRTSAQTLSTVNTHLDSALSALNSAVKGLDATVAMEDGLYGSSAPGKAFETYWSTVYPRATTLVSDVQEVGKALSAAAHGYDEAEDKSTTKNTNQTSGHTGTSGKTGRSSSPPKTPANSGPDRPS